MTTSLRSFTFHSPRGSAKRFTVVGVVDPVTTAVVIGLALCSPIDQFSRRRGRQIATGRALKYPTDVVKINDEVAGDPAAKAFYAYCEDLAVETVEQQLKQAVLDRLEDRQTASV